MGSRNFRVGRVLFGRPIIFYLSVCRQQRAGSVIGRDLFSLSSHWRNFYLNQGGIKFISSLWLINWLIKQLLEHYRLRLLTLTHAACRRGVNMKLSVSRYKVLNRFRLRWFNTFNTILYRSLCLLKGLANNWVGEGRGSGDVALLANVQLCPCVWT